MTVHDCSGVSMNHTRASRPFRLVWVRLDYLSKGPEMSRRILYIRATNRPPLYFRVPGGTFHPVKAVYLPDGEECYGFYLRGGDQVLIAIGEYDRMCVLNEFADLTDIPEAFETSRHKR